MSGAPYDELGARRAARGVDSADGLRPTDHRTRVEYATLSAVLSDAQQLVAELEGTTATSLLVGRDEIEFVTRRLRSMLELVQVEVAQVDSAAVR